MMAADRNPPARREVKAGYKLEGKVALITGGSSGIGKVIALLFALEGAWVAFTAGEQTWDMRWYRRSKPRA